VTKTATEHQIALMSKLKTMG